MWFRGYKRTEKVPNPTRDAEAPRGDTTITIILPPMNYRP